MSSNSNNIVQETTGIVGKVKSAASSVCNWVFVKPYSVVASQNGLIGIVVLLILAVAIYFGYEHYKKTEENEENEGPQV